MSVCVCVSVCRAAGVSNNPLLKPTSQMCMPVYVCVVIKDQRREVKSVCVGVYMWGGGLTKTNISRQHTHTQREDIQGEVKPERESEGNERETQSVSVGAERHRAALAFTSTRSTVNAPFSALISKVSGSICSTSPSLSFPNFFSSALSHLFLCLLPPRRPLRSALSRGGQ